MIERPAHLVERQIRGRAFGNTATLIRTAGSRNSYGEYSETETESAITCATAPLSDRARARLSTQGGVQLDGALTFWTVEDIQPTSSAASGDLIVYDGNRYRIVATQRWGGFSQSDAVRQEGQ